jgi:hypothetical protein
MADEIELNDTAKAAAAVTTGVSDQAWLFGALEGTSDVQPEPIPAAVVAAYMILNAQVFN